MLNRQGIYIIIAIIAIFIIVHFGLAPEQHDPRTIGSTVLGGIAFLLMTTSIFLSTRLRVAENFFGGLDRMYQVHKYCGVIAGILILFHFFGVPKELPENADPLIMALVPSAPLGMVALIVLVLSLAITLNRKIAYHRWRKPHKAMGLVYFLVIGHFMTAPSVFFERFNYSGLILIAAAIIGVSSYLYSMFGMNKKTGLKYKIVSANKLERATELVLSPIAEKLEFMPGQFAFLEIQGKTWNEPHPFTISSATSDDNLRFTLKVLGDWTRKIRDDLEAGGEVIIRGPYGRFNSAKAGNKQVWVAGGIGITPFLSKLRSIKKDDPREITLLYGVREQKEALFFDELKKLCKALPKTNIILLESNKGQFANVKDMKARLKSPLSSYDYFLCGPKPMLNAVKKDLKIEGVTRDKIHSEAFEFR